MKKDFLRAKDYSVFFPEDGIKFDLHNDKGQTSSHENRFFSSGKIFENPRKTEKTDENS